MSEQIQCPNCGGYKIFVDNTSLVDPKTHKGIDVGSDIFSFVGCSTFIVGAIIGGFIIWQIFQNVNGVIYGGIILGLIISGVAVPIRRAVLSRHALTVYYCYCQICGKKFHDPPTW